jgi:hypothetical protein
MNTSISSITADLEYDANKLQEYNLPSVYNHPHPKISPEHLKDIEKRVQDLLSEAAALLKSINLELGAIVANLSTAEADPAQQFFGCAAMRQLVKSVTETNNGFPNPSIVMASNIFKGKVSIFKSIGSGNDLRLVTNDIVRTSRETTLRELLFFYYRIYVKVNEKTNKVSVNCQLNIHDLEQCLVGLYTKGYHIDCGLLGYLTSNLSDRPNKQLPQYGSEVNLTLRGFMPFYFEWRHNGIMYPWVQRIFYGKCRNNEPAPPPYEINRTILHENIIVNNIGLASSDIPQNLEILVEATIPVFSSMSSNSSPDIITPNKSSSIENNFVESSVDSSAI